MLSSNASLAAVVVVLVSFTELTHATFYYFPICFLSLPIFCTIMLKIMKITKHCHFNFQMSISYSQNSSFLVFLSLLLSHSFVLLKFHSKYVIVMDNLFLTFTEIIFTYLYLFIYYISQPI